MNTNKTSYYTEDDIKRTLVKFKLPHFGTIQSISHGSWHLSSKPVYKAWQSLELLRLFIFHRALSIHSITNKFKNPLGQMLEIKNANSNQPSNSWTQTFHVEVPNWKLNGDVWRKQICKQLIPTWNLLSSVNNKIHCSFGQGRLVQID